MGEKVASTLFFVILSCVLLAGCSGCKGTSIEGEADTDTAVDPITDLMLESDVVLDPGIDPVMDPEWDPVLDPHVDTTVEDPVSDWPASDCTLVADVSIEVSNWIIRIGGGIDYEMPSQVSVGPGGRILVTGMHGPPYEDKSLMLLEIDGTGNVLEQTFVDGVSGESMVSPSVGPPSTVPLADCGTLLVGTRRDVGSGGSDVWLSRLHHDGSIIWEKVLGGTRHETWPGAIETDDGGILMVAVSDSFTGSHDDDLWIVKLDRYGNIVWQTSLGGVFDELFMHPDCLAEAPDGTLYIVGKTRSFSYYYDVWIVSLDEDGSYLWQMKLSTESMMAEASIYDLLVDSSEVVLIGQTDASSFDDEAAWAVKLSRTGSLIWQRAYGIEGRLTATGIAPRGGGGYIVSGRAQLDLSDNADLWLASLNPDGSIDWQRFIGDGEYDQDFKVAIHAGGLVVAGEHAWYVGENQFDLTVARLTADGLIPEGCSQISDGTATVGEARMVLEETDDVPLSATGTISDAPAVYTSLSLPGAALCPE